MPTRHCFFTVILATLTVLSLAACAPTSTPEVKPPTPGATPTPSPTATSEPTPDISLLLEQYLDKLCWDNICGHIFAAADSQEARDLVQSVADWGFVGNEKLFAAFLQEYLRLYEPRFQESLLELTGFRDLSLHMCVPELREGNWVFPQEQGGVRCDLQLCYVPAAEGFYMYIGEGRPESVGHEPQVLPRNWDRPLCTLQPAERVSSSLEAALIAQGGVPIEPPAPPPVPAASPTPVSPTETVPPSAPPDMVYVPAGEFIMGSDEGRSDEQPVHTVYLDAFYIDKTEVTNARYRECMEAGACDAPSILPTMTMPTMPNTRWFT
jgi:hypothetical protein